VQSVHQTVQHPVGCAAQHEGSASGCRQRCCCCMLLGVKHGAIRLCSTCIMKAELSTDCWRELSVCIRELCCITCFHL
jgi:hypothetical protein